MQSAKDLAAHLATLPADLIKSFRLRQALKWHAAPEHRWRETIVHALDRRAFPDLVTLVVRYAALDDRLVELLPESHLRRGLLLDLDGNRLSAPAVTRLQAAATRAGTALRIDHQS